MRRSSSLPPPPDSGSVSPPPHLNLQVLASRAALEGERKVVTVLFADLRGSMGMVAGADPEETQALLDAVLGAMVAAVHRYEGAVNQVLGDGIMALFGAPIAHEDHALRAACAARAMQQAVSELRDPLWEARGKRPEIRVGLHSGEVAIRAVRNDLSMDYRAVGSTTHIAARMEQLAKPGCVWLTEDTYKLARGLLRTSHIGPTQVRGVPQPIDVHELQGISVLTRFQANALRGLSGLAGRASTISQLEAALEDAGKGQSRVAVLYGEPGVGKSRLCYELLQRAGSKLRVLEASCLSYLSTRPHGLLASLGRALCGIEDDDDPEQILAKTERCASELGEEHASVLPVARELFDLPGYDAAWARLEPLQKRRRIEGLLRALLERFCARGPCVLLFEDLHWSDADSLQFLAELVADPPGASTLVLLTHRPGLITPWRDAAHVISCEVTALDRGTAEGLLAQLLGDAPELAPLRAWLAERTDGNPFFIEESARAVLESGLVRVGAQGPGGARFDVPASIEALLSARVDRLPESALEVLQAAAVLGDDASVECLRSMTALSGEALSVGLEVLTRADLLYQAEVRNPSQAEGQASATTIRFRHALVQEVVYNRLLRPRRRALHSRVIEVISEQYKSRIAEFVDSLAEHAYRAERWAQCAEFERAACTRAAGRGANALALAHLERGLSALSNLPPGAEHARAAVDLRLTALAPLLPLGAHERVIELLSEAVRYAQQLGDPGREARVHTQLCAELWVIGRYAQAQAAAERALELLPQCEGEQFALEISTRYNLVMVQHARAELRAARAGLAQLLAAVQGPAALRRLGWAGYPSVLIRTFVITVASMSGDFADAAQAFAEGRALADQLGHGFSRAMITEQYGMCLLVQGEVERARELLREALTICEHDEVSTMVPPSATHLAQALIEQGELGPARSLLDGVDELALERGGHYALGYKRFVMSRWHHKKGDLAAARAEAELSVQETSACGERGFHVKALVQLGDVLADDPAHSGLALQVYDQALTRARELGMQPYVAFALGGMSRLLARRGEGQRAESLRREAAALWTQLGAPARARALQE